MSYFDDVKPRLQACLPEYMQETRRIDVKDKRNIKCQNPNHDDKTPSMTYYEGDHRLYCHACNARYDIIDLISMDRGLNSADALKWGCEHYGISTPEAKSPTERKTRPTKEKEHEATARKAAAIYSEAAVCPDNHAYLQRKRVRADGTIKLNTKTGDIVIPLYDVDGKIQSAQYISADGRKLYAKDAQKRGAFFPFGGEAGLKAIHNRYEPLPVYVVEGYATGAALVEILNAGNKALNKDYALIAAMDAGNIPVVVETLNEAGYGAGYYIYADDDSRKGNNTGTAAAFEAVKAVQALSPYVETGVFTPPFDSLNLDAASTATDFNDYYVEALNRGISPADMFAAVSDLKPLPIPATETDTAPWAGLWIPPRWKGREAQFYELRKRPRAFVRGKAATMPDADVSYIIGGIIRARSITLLHAESGVGKSHVTLDIAFHHSCKKCADWHGLDLTHGTAYFLAGEGQEDVKLRFNAWCEHHGADPEQCDFLTLNTSPADLKENAGRDDLMLQIDTEIANGANPPTLIVVDTFRTFFSGKENSADETEAFLKNIRLIAAQYGATVIITHHEGKGEGARGKARGSTNIIAGVDAEFSLDAVKIDCFNTEFRLTPKKIRRGNCEIRYAVKATEVPCGKDWTIRGTGELEHTLILVGNVTTGAANLTDGKQISRSQKAVTKRQQNASIVLEHIRALNTEEHRKSKTGEVVIGARQHALKPKCREAGLNDYEYRIAIDHLFEEGMIINGKAGYIVVQYDKQTTIKKE